MRTTFQESLLVEIRRPGNAGPRQRGNSESRRPQDGSTKQVVMLLKVFRAFWKPLTVAILAIVATVADLWSLKDQVAAGWKSLKDLWASPGALTGCLLILIPVSAIIAFIVWAGWIILNKAPIGVNVRIALRQVLRQYRKHFGRAIATSRPTRFSLQRNRRWNDLVATSLQGISDDEIMLTYSEAGRADQPFLFCSFQAYAHAVARVLHRLQTVRCQRPYPQVWTIFKRPVCNWYNTFPVEWIENEHVIRGQVTFPWWETYKDNVARLRGTESKVQFYRVVADPDRDRTDYPADLRRYFLYHPDPITIHEAGSIARQYDKMVEWHPSIGQFLQASELEGKGNISIFLIGKPLSADALPERQRLVTHFQSTFHDRGDPEILNGGVYVRYVKTRSHVPRRLAMYDDVFIVKFSQDDAFGLAFINDDIRDVTGVRLLLQQDLRVTETATPQTLFDQIYATWDKHSERM